MHEFEAQIRELARKTVDTRYQFLLTELQTCSLGLEMADHQLSVGNLEIAKREIVLVAKGIEAMERLMPSLPAAERGELEVRFAELKAAFLSVQQRVDPPAA